MGSSLVDIFTNKILNINSKLRYLFLLLLLLLHGYWQGIFRHFAENISDVKPIFKQYWYSIKVFPMNEVWAQCRCKKTNIDLQPIF